MKHFSYYQLIAIGLGIYFLDFVSKYYLASSSFLVTNNGISFGLLQNKYWATLVIPVLVLIIYMLSKTKKPLQQLGLVFVFSSGLSNFTDRLVYGYVRDFIHYPYINLVGNVADIFIVAGIIILVFGQIIIKKK